jgi:hypothetical protein
MKMGSIFPTPRQFSTDFSPFFAQIAWENRDLAAASERIVINPIAAMT